MYINEVNKINALVNDSLFVFAMGGIPLIEKQSKELFNVKG